MGILYGRGLGTTQNYEKAIEWESKAANQGIALAQRFLGYCYAEGKGIKQNYEKALEWYTKAAEQGDAIAQIRLGRLYRQGKGVHQNYENAFEWFIKAAEQGQADAKKILEEVTNIEENMKVTDEDLANAWTDEFGVIYSVDRKRLLRIEETFDTEHYLIHDEVKVICDSAFQNCEKLIEVIIPNSVKFIGSHAFAFCTRLTNIIIPNSVVYIGAGAFTGNYSLIKIKVDTKNSNYDSRNNCNAIIETSSNTLIAGCQNTRIPNGVTNIYKSALSFDKNLFEIQ